MKRNTSLYEMSDDELAKVGGRAAARAVREIRAAGLKPAGADNALRASRKAAAGRTLQTPSRRLKAAARGA